LTNPQVPAEGGDPKDVDAILQNREEDATTAGLVAIYSDLLMLHALAVDHFQKRRMKKVSLSRRKKKR